MTVSDLRPAAHDFRIRRGDNFADFVEIQEGDPLAPVDVSARSYAMQFRLRDDSGEPIDAAISMAQADDGIVTFSLDKTVTAEMSGLYLYDFEQTVAGVVRTLMAGSFVVSDDVTRGS